MAFKDTVREILLRGITVYGKLVPDLPQIIDLEELLDGRRCTIPVPFFGRLLLEIDGEYLVVTSK